MRVLMIGLAAITLTLTGACQPAPSLPDDLEGRWDVQQIAGAGLGDGVEIDVQFDTAEGRLSGFSGCNRFTAPVTSFGESISIGAVSEEDAPCASPAAATDETRFLMVLGSIGRFVRHGRSLELLPREQGEALLRLRYADDQNGGDD